MGSMLLQAAACVARSLYYCGVEECTRAKTFDQDQACEAVRVGSVCQTNARRQLVYVLGRALGWYLAL